MSEGVIGLLGIGLLLVLLGASPLQLQDVVLRY